MVDVYGGRHRILSGEAKVIEARFAITCRRCGVMQECFVENLPVLTEVEAVLSDLVAKFHCQDCGVGTLILSSCETHHVSVH